VLRGQIESLRDYLDTPAGKVVAAGVIAVDDWDIAVRTLAAAGLVDAARQGADYVELSLVTPVDLNIWRP
jgi:hypothetical protein